jgi:hypothetical protein
VCVGIDYRTERREKDSRYILYTESSGMLLPPFVTFAILYYPYYSLLLLPAI